MSTSSFKFYGLCKSALSQHADFCRISSHFVKSQWSNSRRQFVRVTSTYFNQDNVNYFACCDKPKARRKTGLHVTCNEALTVRGFTSIPGPAGKSLDAVGATHRTPLTVAQKFVQSFPEQYHPYLKLSRIDRPIGTWLLFWPSTWGLAVASGGIPDLKLLALFGVGSFVMRGAGCTVNDMWDRHIDPQVKRTSDRPLAAQQIRMRHAVVWLGAQLSVAFGILLQLNPSCFLVSCGALALVCLYPLAKRVTYWPQAVLGLTFNTGILIGYAAANLTHIGIFDIPYLDPACLSLYASGVLWTLIYDTIYAHQDIQDDTLLGLGSTARRFGDNTKLWLTGFSTLMVSSLTTAGILAELSWPYYLGIGGVSAHLIWQIRTLNTKDVANCAERFSSNRHIGWLILISLLASYLVKEDFTGKQKLNFPQIAPLESKENAPVTKYAGLVSSGL